jgi:hypothetical protein
MNERNETSIGSVTAWSAMRYEVEYDHPSFMSFPRNRAKTSRITRKKE